MSLKPCGAVTRPIRRVAGATRSSAVLRRIRLSRIDRDEQAAGRLRIMEDRDQVHGDTGAHVDVGAEVVRRWSGRRPGYLPWPAPTLPRAPGR